MSLNDDAFLQALRKRDLGLALFWEIIPPTGGPLRFTSHDQDVDYTGVGLGVFTASSSFGGSAVTGREGLSVDNLSIIGITSDEITEQDLTAGVYDDAEIYLYLGHWDNTALGLKVLKRGRLGEITATEAGFEAEVRGLAEFLQRPQGRTYTLECDVVNFGDSRCGFDIVGAGFVDAQLVSGIGDFRTFKADIVQADGYYQYGLAQFTSGKNAGRAVEILGSTSAGDGVWITMLEKMPFAIEIGDAVTITRGCPRTFQFCQSIGNTPNFRGYPHMPTEDQILETPSAR